jgi:multidrug efflux pump subunit AcrA (membrane-fusion protein)
VDIERPDLKRKRRRRITFVILSLAALSGAAIYGVSRLRPALPSVERSAIWTDTVKRGPMIRQVRGIGTLVPREDRLRLIPAETDGTVVRIDILPGAKVEPDSLVMELTDPQL